MDVEAEGASIVPNLIFIINKIALKFTLSSWSGEMMLAFDVSLLVMSDWVKYFKQVYAWTGQDRENHVCIYFLVSA